MDDSTVPTDRTLVRPERCLVMGVVNVTEDSFSDGGQFLDAADAVRHGRELLAQGADIIDVGGESTRPGAKRVPAPEELGRVLPVVRELAAAGAVVSVDTMRAAVAAAAVEAGARIINDVSGGLADPDMVHVAADTGVPFILMHWVSPDNFRSGAGGSAHTAATVVPDVLEHLQRRVDAALAAGCAPEQLIVDPGLGFAKGPESNWALLSALGALQELGFPVLVAASRKRFLGSLLGDGSDGLRPPKGRDVATAAISALSAAAGAWAVRVHDVRSSVDAVQVATAWKNGGNG